MDAACRAPSASRNPRSTRRAPRHPTQIQVPKSKICALGSSVPRTPHSARRNPQPPASKCISDFRNLYHLFPALAQKHHCAVAVHLAVGDPSDEALAGEHQAANAGEGVEALERAEVLREWLLTCDGIRPPARQPVGPLIEGG
eukprot:4235138-Alexandrium_andersonii.AAC.1